MQITQKNPNAVKRVLMALGSGAHQICADDVREALEETTRLAEQGISGEREQCALVCEELHFKWHFGEESGPRECAREIRRRGSDIGGKDNEKQGENHE